MSTPQAKALAERWPATYQALVTTYYPAEDFCRTRPDGSNDGGYVLQSLSRYARAALDLFAHKGVTPGTLDQAAAREVYYHWSRGTQFRRPAAGLSACFASLIFERPEHLLPRAKKEATNAPH